MAGEYLDSAHGDTTSGVQRPALAGAYAIGNCGHCHEQHGSIAGLSAANGPFVYLEAENEEDLCFACHNTSEANGAPDIDTDITTPGNHGHLAQNYSGIHRSNETLSISKHIECTDCHNPHKANDTLHTPGSETAATVLTTSSPLYGVTGTDPDYFSTTAKYGIWEAPASEDYTLQTATKEYQICFKCHSLANVDLTSWDGSDAEAWTDVGLDFSPYNRAGHPVVTGLNNYPNSITVDRGAGPYKGLYNTTDGVIYDQLLDPWGDNAGDQTMYCTDCHASNSSVAGPHGSNVKWMLAGTNKAWPYTTFARNGSNETEVAPDPYDFVTSKGTFEIFRRLEDTEIAITNPPLGLGTDDGLFCSNCHPVSQWTLADNNAHSPGQHSRARCIDCHIRVPHGSKVSRLIASVDDTTYTGHLPPRYTASGTGLNGSGATQPQVRLFQKKPNYSYNAGRCLSYSTTYENATAATKLCNFHSIGPGGLGETW